MQHDVDCALRQNPFVLYAVLIPVSDFKSQKDYAPAVLEAAISLAS